MSKPLELDTRTVAQAYYDAVQRRDFAAALALFADDIILREPASLPFGGTHYGRDAFMQALGGAMQLVDTDYLVLEHLMVDGDRVAAFVKIRLRQRPEEPSHCIDWLLIRDGRIAELMPFYFDTAALLRT